MRAIWPAASTSLSASRWLVAHGFLHNVGIGLCVASEAIAVFGWLSQRQSGRRSQRPGLTGGGLTMT
jgi:hypothetical protein